MNRDTYEIRFEFEKESTSMFWAKEEYAFEKTEVWISKIPEALETDGKAQRERVFKNFEGDNRNEFRVK